MLRMIDIFEDVPVLSLRTGDLTARVVEPIINPSGLKLVGFFVKPLRQKEHKVLLVDDIRELVPEGVVIDEEEKLSDVEDLVRVKEIIDINYIIIGKRVVTDKKRKVGRVKDYAVNDSNWNVQKIFVAKNVVRDFNTLGRSIDRKQIIEVTNKKVVVKDVDQKVEERAWATSTPPA